MASFDLNDSDERIISSGGMANSSSSNKGIISSGGMVGSSSSSIDNSP